MKIKSDKALKPLTSEEALIELKNYFLGEDWYVVDPLHGAQVNAIIVDDIKKMYRSKVKWKNKIKKILDIIFDED